MSNLKQPLPQLHLTFSAGQEESGGAAVGAEGRRGATGQGPVAPEARVAIMVAGVGGGETRREEEKAGGTNLCRALFQEACQTGSYSH